MNNLRFRLSDRFQRLGGIALTLMFILLSTASAWADEHPDIGSIKYNSEIGAYEINSVQNLDDLATYVNALNQDGGQLHDCSGMTFKMTADIKYAYEADTKNNYTPIGWDAEEVPDFKGTFDGQGHTVSGIRINIEGVENDGYLGLIGYLGEGGSVCHVTLSDAIIIGGRATGGIVGKVNSDATISDCHVTSNVVISSYSNGLIYKIGGIVGVFYDGSIVSGCTSMAQVKNISDEIPGDNFGGIAGYNGQASMRDCLYLGGQIEGNILNFGAVIGSCASDVGKSSVINCYYTNSDFVGRTKKDDGTTEEITEDGSNKAIGSIVNAGAEATITNTGLAHTITLGSGIALYDTYKTEYGRLTSYLSSEEGDGFALKYTIDDVTTIYSTKGATVAFKYSGTEPKDGFVVTKAKGGTVEVTKANGIYTFTMPDDDVTIKANLKLALKHAFGDKATATFYLFDGDEASELAPPAAGDISNVVEGGAVTSVGEYTRYVVAHVVPAAGYWTNEALLHARLTAKQSVVQQVLQTRGASVKAGIDVTLIQPDQDRNDGAGWYCFEYPEEGLMTNSDQSGLAYESLLLDGYVLPKFDLSTATVGTDGVTCTIAESQWSTTLTIDESKSSFEYNGSEQGPTKLTNTSIIVKKGDDVAVTFTKVEDHVTALVSAKEGSGLNGGQAIDAGNYALTIKAATTEASVAVDGANTRGSSADIEGPGIFVNSKDVDFTITQKKVKIVPSVKNKEYDSKKTAEIDVEKTTIATGIDGEALKYVSGLTAEFGDAKAGTGKSVVVTGTPKVEKGNDNTKVANYDFSVAEDVKANITAKALTIKAEAQSKVYGEADPTLTYTKEGLLEGDPITGALARAEGEDVGEYAITQGTLSAGDNYTITFTGAKLTINAADFAEGDVTAKDYEGVYDGEAHTITVTAPKSATVEYDTKKDSYDLKEAPSYTDAGKYTVYYKVSMPNTNPVTGRQIIKIGKKTLTITANAQEKVAGEKDPDLTYTSDGLVEGDAITGALARAEGEGVGEYDITQGTLSAGDNYTITFTGAKLTIKDIKGRFKVVVAESEGGSVSVSKIEASPGTQINMKINPKTGYHLETITIKKIHGGEVQHDITFDAKDESWDYFLMPSDDVIITAVFEKDKDAQNIFIYKSYYGEVVANTISADENEPVNLVAHPAYDNCVLDELVVINDEGKQLDLTTSYDSKEGKIYTFMMAGNWVQVYSTFRGTNDVVDGARPFGLDKRFYQLSLKNLNILQTTAETKDVQIAMSLNANIFCQVAEDGSLMKKQGEDVGLMIGGLKKGNWLRIDHDGEIALEIPDIIKAINDAFQQPAHILTRGEDTAIIKPGVAYEVVEDVNLELVLKGSAPLVIKSIIVEGPDPTAINRLQADDEAADIYDLSGRKVDPTSLRKGMYIRNGKKIVIK